jgi:hypothetical protein
MNKDKNQFSFKRMGLTRKFQPVLHPQFPALLHYGGAIQEAPLNCGPNVSGSLDAPMKTIRCKRNGIIL